MQCLIEQVDGVIGSAGHPDPQSGQWMVQVIVKRENCFWLQNAAGDDVVTTNPSLLPEGRDLQISCNGG
jgi:hypothetical protein